MAKAENKVQKPVFKKNVTSKAQRRKRKVFPLPRARPLEEKLPKVSRGAESKERPR